MIKAAKWLPFLLISNLSLRLNMKVPEFDTQKMIPVMESFYTLQGEGFNSGRAAYFIRIAGCDVGCHWCDVKESWEVVKDQLRSMDEVVEEAANHPSRFAVVTGGEPLIYDMDPLSEKLIEKGFELAIETSGAYPLIGKWHWICLSPKKRMPAKEEIFKKANELKVVIYNKDDFKWAEEQRKKVSKDCLLFLQAEWGREEKMRELILEYVKENPEWRISIQSHKYLDIP